jgi:putative ATP-binding cassette transporter
VDLATEAMLYKRLLDSGMSYISIGHRHSLLHFHDQALRLLDLGEWQVTPTALISLDASEDELE